ncbi:MAG: hypothetical protein N2051_13255, partial [Thermoflexus sp.]|nr:hypothetical protein [Thermoflexus sp.]
MRVLLPPTRTGAGRCHRIGRLRPVGDRRLTIVAWLLGPRSKLGQRLAQRGGVDGLVEEAIHASPLGGQAVGLQHAGA